MKLRMKWREKRWHCYARFGGLVGKGDTLEQAYRAWIAVNSRKP